MKTAAAVFSLVFILGACASPTRGLLPGPGKNSETATVELTDTPFFPQTQYQCGPAALATVLATSGIAVTPAELTSRVYLPERKGSLQAELLAATRRHERLPYLIDPDLTALAGELHAGRPVLVLQNLGLRHYPVWHYAVVVGYLPGADRIILRSGTTQRELSGTAGFLRSWQRADSWGFVVLRPGELPARPARDTYLKSVAALESTGHYQSARRAYAAAVSRWPDSALAWFGLGNTHYHLGDLLDAELAYRQAIQADPDFAAAHNNLAEMLAMRGCLQAALATLDAVLGNLQPGDPLRRLLMESRSEILLRQPDGHAGEAASCGQGGSI